MPHESKRTPGELLSMNPSSFVKRCDINVLRAPVVNHASGFGLYKVDDAEHGTVEPAFKWSKNGNVLQCNPPPSAGLRYTNYKHDITGMKVSESRKGLRAADQIQAHCQTGRPMSC